MKRLLPPILLLSALLGLSLWNGSAVSREMDRCTLTVKEAQAAARAGNWTSAGYTLQTGYDRWRSRQTWLHIVEPHDAIEDAEAMYCRALAFAALQEDAEFQAETADLLSQLRMLSEMEAFRLGNIL